MKLFNKFKPKTISVLLTDGFLIPELFYQWLEQAKYKSDPDPCLWHQLNKCFNTKNFSSEIFAKIDLPNLSYKKIVRADPINIQADWQGLSIANIKPNKLSLDDAHQLCDDINLDLKPHNLKIHCASVYNWYITGDKLDSIESTPTICATNDKTHITQKLPDYLNVILNQIQINLYNHPINKKRELEGLPVINSIWLWGLNSQQPATISNRIKLYTENNDIKKYAQNLGIEHQSLDFFNTTKPAVLVLEKTAPEKFYQLLQSQVNKFSVHYRGTIYYY